VVACTRNQWVCRPNTSTDSFPSQLHSPVSQACFLPQVYPRASWRFESNVPTPTAKVGRCQSLYVAAPDEEVLTRSTGNNSLASLKSSTTTLISASHLSTLSWSSISTLSSSWECLKTFWTSVSFAVSRRNHSSRSMRRSSL